MSIHFFEVELILMFVFGYPVPWALLLFGLIMYVEHLRFCFADYLVNIQVLKDYQEHTKDDDTDGIQKG